MPSTQLDALIVDPAEFKAKLAEQRNFTPPGERVLEFKFREQISSNASPLWYCLK